jgi:hypothetical protein
MGEVYMRQFGWSVGNPTQMEEIGSFGHPISGASFANERTKRAESR